LALCSQVGIERIAAAAKALADENRLRILALLLEGPKAVSELVVGLGVTQPGVSAHLALLREAGLVSYEDEGRRRIYRVSTDRVGDLTGALAALSGQGVGGEDLGRQAATKSLSNSPFRQARTCYDHLAGAAGVGLLDSMLEQGWLRQQEEYGRIAYHLTPRGTRELSKRDVRIERALGARRVFAFGCADWTERESHLGGALGAEVLRTLADGGYVDHDEGTRSVAVLKSLHGWTA